MKKFFTIAMVALATVFAVSCNKDDKGDKDDRTEKINLVGTSWEMSFEGTVQGTYLSMDEILNFTSETEGNRHVTATYGAQSITDDKDFTYTWDGSSLAVILSAGTRILTYRASDNTFYMPLSGDPEMAQIAAALGITELVYHQI
jgi:hypothetical protein